MTTQATQFIQTHIAMVLDRSGSMDSCRKTTIDAVNKYLHEARGDSVLKEADFELLSFNTDAIATVRKGAPINVADIAPADYVPAGGTPLYDAIGRGIDGLDGKIANGAGKAILVIVTDGEENSSRKYQGEPGRRAIQELLKVRQDAGWLVVFLGAGIDAARQGSALGVRSGYTANIGLDEASLGATMDNVALASSGYAATASMGEARAFAASTEFSRSARKAMGDATGGDSLAQAWKQPQATKRPVRAPQAPVAPVAKAGDTWDKTDGDAWGQ